MRYVVIFLMHSSKELAMTTLPVLLMLEEDRMKRRKRDNASTSFDDQTIFRSNSIQAQAQIQEQAV